MHREGPKLNPTAPLTHPSLDGYLKLIVQII